MFTASLRREQMEYSLTQQVGGQILVMLLFCSDPRAKIGILICPHKSSDSETTGNVVFSSADINCLGRHDRSCDVQNSHLTSHIGDLHSSAIGTSFLRS